MVVVAKEGGDFAHRESQLEEIHEQYTHEEKPALSSSAVVDHTF